VVGLRAQWEANLRMERASPSRDFGEGEIDLTQEASELELSPEQRAEVGLT
jgi:hypothetical protein